MYEVEYCDGYVAAMVASVIAENLFVQVDQEDNRFLLIESIMDTRTDGMQKIIARCIRHNQECYQTKKNTTKGWEVCI